MEKFNHLLIILIAVFAFSTPQTFAASLQNMPLCHDIKEKVNQGALLVDVRTKEEFVAGSLPGAINIPFDQIESQRELFSADKKQPIILYCKSGRRSELGKQTLTKLGYLNVINAGSYSELLNCWKIK